MPKVHVSNSKLHDVSGVLTHSNALGLSPASSAGSFLPSNSERNTMFTQNDGFKMANGVLLTGPFNSQIFVRGRDKPLDVENVTGEGPENVSHASIMVLSDDGDSTTDKLPLGKSQYSIPNGAIIISASDDVAVKVMINWES